MSSDSERAGTTPSRLLKVGLTGGIACGKSHVLRCFSELGAYPIDADAIAHELIEVGRPAYREIVERFGEGVLDSAGRIDRKRLGALVFRDAVAREDLNRILHPKIIQEEARRLLLCDPGKTPMAVVDAALMIEVGTYRRYDVIVVAYCPPPLQVERLMRRNGLSREESLLRLESQMSVYRKLAYADYVIDTTGPYETTEAQVRHVFHDILYRKDHDPDFWRDRYPET
ncbi:MAG: dephospho-CoA kinase [Acidobacteriota bacterium]